MGRRREADLRFAGIAVSGHRRLAGRKALGLGQIALHVCARQGGVDKRLHRRKRDLPFLAMPMGPSYREGSRVNFLPNHDRSKKVG